MNSLPLRTQLAMRAGNLAASASRHLGRGEGSVIGGRVTLALDPNSLNGLASGRSVALVSGTNGKTTTTAMLTAALESTFDVVTNDTGSNMFGGMVAALSRSSAAHVVLETDEVHLPKTMELTRPRLVMLLNLTRDQLDRVSEVRMLAAKWREVLRNSDAIVVANVDDPMVVWAAEVANKVVWTEGGGSWRLDASSCPSCGSQIAWTYEDTWACDGCSLQRPRPHARYTDEMETGSDLRLPVNITIPGDINKHNAVMALTSAVMIGAEPADAAKALAGVKSPGGRFTLADIADAKVRLILAKNPAGWSEALRITEETGHPLVVSINARVQDGRDPSWLWDVPFEKLSDRFVVATGERGRDLAVRLRYAGVRHEYRADATEAVRQASTHAPGALIDVIGNYSAFQDYRSLANA